MLSCREIGENGHVTVPETRYVIMLHMSYKPFPCEMYCSLLSQLHSDFTAVSVGTALLLEMRHTTIRYTHHRTRAVGSQGCRQSEETEATSYGRRGTGCVH